MRPRHPLAASGHYLPHGHGAFQLHYLHLLSSSKDRSPSDTSCSALRRPVRLLRHLLTSAALFRRFSAAVAPLPVARRQISRGKTRDLHAIYLSHLQPHHPGDIGLWVNGPLALMRLPLMRFLFVRPALCLQLPSDPPYDNALAVRLTVPITRARRGLSPPSHRTDTIPVERCLRTTRHARRTQ